jgi:hypothetical protein
VLVSALPWQIPDDTVEIVLGVAPANTPGERLPVQTEETDVVLLENETLLHLGAFDRTHGVLNSAWKPAESPNMPALLNVQFGDRLALEAGSILPYRQGDDVVQAHLEWRIDGEPPQTWNVVLQLLDSAGNRKAQLDTQARVGAFETTLAGLPADASVAGRYSIPLPKPLAPGEYRVIVGLNDWNAGAPVAVESANAVLNDFVTLGTFTVK